MELHIEWVDSTGGGFEPICQATLPPVSFAWRDEGRLPTEEEILPSRMIALPDGNSVRIGVAYESGGRSITLHAWQNGHQFLLLMVRALHSVIVQTPAGSMLSISCYDQDHQAA